MKPDSEAAHYWHDIARRRGLVICKLQRLLCERPPMEFYMYRELADQRRLVIAKLQKLLTENSRPRKRY